jgi:HK97 gp10 family phage protein
MTEEINVRVEGLAPLLKMMALAPQIVQDEAVKAMRKSVLAVEGEAKSLVAVKTGDTRRSITSRVVPLIAGVEGIVGTNKKHAPYLEHGTGIYGPHGTPIVPVTKKALAWKGPGGAMIVRRSVKGMKARPFLRPAFDHKVREVENYFRQALHNVLRRIVQGGR